MSTERELLELAAKAAGYEGVADDHGIWLHITNHRNGGWYWNPLIDDGDALRLAVKLNMDICRGLRGPEITIAVLAMHGDLTVAEALDDDPYAATRRAIVRAAAEIGRQM